MRRMFSENQIERIAKYVAQHDLSDVDLNVASINAGAGAFGGAVTAKTLSQSEPNYTTSFDITTTQEAFEKVYQYAKVEVVNGEVHIIACVAFRNISESQQNLNISRNIIYVTDEIGQKIKGLNGNSVYDGNGGIIRIAIAGRQTGSNRTIGAVEISNQTKNQLIFEFGSINAVAAGGMAYLTMEANLSLF